jgi:glycosyltransferase involved in cell wall biosynthesis
MSEALARRGHRVHVVTYPMRQAIPVRGVQIHRTARFLASQPVTVGPTVYRPLLDLLLVVTLVRTIRRERLDLVHAHNYEGALAGYVAARVTGRPLIYHAVNTMIDELPSYRFIRPHALAVGLARLLDAIVPRAADHVIALSEELRRFVAARGVSPSRLSVVPAGVHPEMFDRGDGERLRRRFGLGDAPVVVYTGILDEFQRLDYLLQAMTRVAADVPQARLLVAANIATDGDIERLHRQARELNVADRLVVAWPTTLEELPDFLAAADVAVCPRPATPGFPVKMLNYMAARKAIVTFRGSAKGLRHLQEAFVVDDHDWAALGEGISRLLIDRALASRLGANARAAIQGRFDWPSLAQTIERIYWRLLGVKTPSGAPSQSPRP